MFKRSTSVGVRGLSSVVEISELAKLDSIGHLRTIPSILRPTVLDAYHGQLDKAMRRLISDIYLLAPIVVDVVSVPGGFQSTRKVSLQRFAQCVDS